MRHLLSIADLADDDLDWLVRRGVDFSSGGVSSHHQPLGGRVVAIYFRRTSTRTRTGFSSGALRLGAKLISYGPDDLQENTGETIEDTARVLASMLDGLVARTTGSTAEMRALASQDRMAVINAMSAAEHPTQALADLTTLWQRFGGVEGLRVLYVGEGNNTAAALALALARYRGVELQLRTPPGFGLDQPVLRVAVAAAQRHGAVVVERHDMASLPSGVEVVYTTRWQTTGTTKPDPGWRRVFAPFRVDEALMARYPDAVFMHDLPAHRGEEVDGPVLDGPASIAFVQAENKLHSAMAVLEWCLAGPSDSARGVRGHRARVAAEPLVGRHEELDRLRGALERAARERACQLVTVLGPTGVGRSRLALELAESVADEALLLRARCLSYGAGVTLWPLTQILWQLPRPAAEIVAGHEHAELIVERLGTGRIEDRYWAARKLLEALSRQRPLVVVLEDLQWAEPTFLDFVEQLAGSGDDAPVLLVCLASPELLERRPGWAQGPRGASTIRLAPLPDAESDELIDRLLAGTAVSWGRRAMIRRAAAGSPLYIEQAAAMLRHGGAAAAGGEAGAAGAEDLPRTVQALLAARLDRLQPGERAVLERAAVEGVVFHLGVVLALTPPELRAEVPVQLESLVRQQLVRPWPAEHPGEEGYRFRHPLVRDATYAAVPIQARAELHEGVAAWLQRRDPAAVTVSADEIVGYHLERACHDRGERASAALRRRAAQHLGVAGGRAQALVDLIGAGAANLLGRAVELLPADDPQRCELLPDLAASLAEPAQYGRAEAVLAEGLELASAAGDRRLAARLQVERAWLRFHMDPASELAAAVQEIEQAVPALEQAGDDRALARAWYAHGSLMFSLGRAARARETLERGVTAARRAGDRRAEVDLVWQLAGPLFWGPTPADEAIGISRELCAQLPPVSQPEAFMRMMEAVFAAMLGRAGEARNLYRRAEARYRELGVRMTDVGAPQYSSRLHLLLGDVQVAVAELRELCRMSEQRGDTGYLSTSAGLLAEALYQQGGDADAWQASETSERSAAADDFVSQMLWRGVRAKLLARRGEHEEAERLARETVAIGEPSDYLFVRGDSLRDLAEVLLLAGRRAAAAEAARAALGLYQRKGDLVSAARVRELLASREHRDAQRSLR